MLLGVRVAAARHVGGIKRAKVAEALPAVRAVQAVYFGRREVQEAQHLYAKFRRWHRGVARRWRTRPCCAQPALLALVQLQLHLGVRRVANCILQCSQRIVSRGFRQLLLHAAVARCEALSERTFVPTAAVRHVGRFRGENGGGLSCGWCELAEGLQRVSCDSVAAQTLLQAIRGGGDFRRAEVGQHVDELRV